jgi:SOS-response transcriptional repressor LexA
MKPKNGSVVCAERDRILGAQPLLKCRIVNCLPPSGRYTNAKGTGISLYEGEQVALEFGFHVPDGSWRNPTSQEENSNSKREADMWDISNMSGLKEFTRQRLNATGRNPFEAAKIGGLERSFVNDILIEKKKTVQGRSIGKLALALDTSPEAIVRAMAGEPPTETTPQPLGQSTVHSVELETTPVRVIGKAKAGEFISVEDMGDWDEPRYVQDIRDSRFPNARHLAFDVEGDSMNALKPRAIMDGDQISALAYEDIQDRMPLRDGMIVVVERTRHGGIEREWSVKQLEIYEDRVEFHPRSTNPRYKPIVVARDNAADDGVSVTIIAVVRRLVAEFM